MVKFKHGNWILVLETTKHKNVTVCACRPAHVQYPDTGKQQIVICAYVQVKKMASKMKP